MKKIILAFFVGILLLIKGSQEVNAQLFTCCNDSSECGGKTCITDPSQVPAWCTQGEKKKGVCQNTIFTTPSPVSAGTGIFCNGTTNKLNTAIGCIDISNSTELIGFILKWAIGIGGGVAFLLILYSSFMIMTSQGIPERLKAGQELLTSAVMGLILLIFSVFILELIGISILNIPGFNTV